jgi:hypothetical protein
MTGNRKVILAASLVLAITAPAALAAHSATNHRTNIARISARARVRSVTSPPTVIRPGERLKLRIRATPTPVLYLSREPRRDRTSVRLSGRVHMRGGRGTAAVAVPRKLSPGAWFVLACVPRGRCTASKTPGVVPLTHPGRPVNASVTLAGASAASATIGTAGGSLQATGPNGTRYLLTIPPNSLAQDTAITMTPLGGLSGARFAGKLVGGVQFAPEGLLLFRGATLTISPRHPVPARRQVPFGYTGTGADVHIVPLAPAKGKIEIPLAHFSGAGVGNSPAGPAGAPAASDNADFYGQLLGQLEADWRDGSMPEAQFDSAAASLLNDMYRDIMNEEVPPGLNDDTAATTAIKDLLAWAGTAETLLSSHDEINWGRSEIEGRVFPTVIKLMFGVYHRAQQRCANNHDLSEINNHIVPDARNLELLGVPEIPISELYSCLHFKVQIDSVIHHAPQSDGDPTLDFHYQATVPIKYDGGNLGFLGSPPVDGSGPGTYVSASGSESSSGQCVYDNSPYTQATTLTAAHGNTVKVSAFSFPLSAQDTSPLQLTLDSSASEDYHFQMTDPSGDPRCTSSLDETLQNWWEQAGIGSVIDGNATFTPDAESIVIPLDRGSGEVFAQKTLLAPADLGDSGQTTITVIHDPPSP